MKEKIKLAMQLVSVEEEYIRKGLTMNYEDADTLAHVKELLEEVYDSISLEHISDM